MTPYPDNTAADTSEYTFSSADHNVADLGNLSSDQFTNIRKIYTSPVNGTEIYSTTRYGKRYILKAVAADFKDDPIKNLALKKEFDIGISLDHPNIRQTIGYEHVDGIGNVMILEYFDSDTLSNFLRHKQLDRAQARAIAAQIASALQYIHAKGILHRDLKPSNILVSHRWAYVKIIDFSLSDSDAFVIFKNPAGTQKYMAPEIKNGAAPTSVLTDIYSFGMVINDLAEAASDSALLNIARVCTRENPRRRPNSLAYISLPKPGKWSIAFSRILFSKITMAVLAAVCLFLIVLIFWLSA